METPYFAIHQVYIDPDTDKKYTKEIANVATQPMVDSLLQSLNESLSEIGDSNIYFQTYFVEK